MKRIIPFFTSTLFLHISLSAALPLSWDVELTAQPPQVFSLQRPRGESYELEAVLKNRGKPFAQAITNACIYWQTNGMENLYWSAPASVSNNVLRASWLPSMDPGATTVRGYIGDPGRIYAAAFQFRFISSPGATQNALPLPTPVIDFAKVRVLNPPWGSGGGGVDTNAVRDIAREEIVPATNRLNQTLTDALDAKRDKDDLNVYECVTNHTENTDLEVESNVIDRLATTNGVNAAIEANERTGKLNQVVRGFCDGDPYDPVNPGNLWYIYVLKSSTAYGIEEDYWDFGDHPTTLSGYGITDAAPISMISASDPTFSNEVATVALTVTPQPSPTLRLFDEVRQCYWIGKMVNGVINWEVE